MRRSNLLRFIKTRFGVNRAVSYTFIGHALSIAGIPIIAFLVMRKCTAAEQGYYYTFGSLLALQTFFELGFGQCLTQFVAHEFAHLSLDETGAVVGNGRCRDRFFELLRFGYRFYSIAAAAEFVGLVVIGGVFFGTSHDGVSWKVQWVLLSLGAALNLLLVGASAVLQGCNEVAWLARTRAIANASRTATLAVSLLWGFKLYAPGIASLVSFGCLLILVSTRWHRVIRRLFADCTRESRGSLSWRQEIWPVQWRIGLSWLFTYLASNTVTPIAFKLCGAVDAGRFGFTFNLMQNVGVVAAAWNITSMPAYCMAVSRKDWQGLNTQWRKNNAISFLACLFGALAVFSLVLICNRMGLRYSSRMLAPSATAVLVLVAVAQNLFSAIGYYLRAYNREPLLPATITAAFGATLGAYIAARYGNVSAITVALLCSTTATLAVATYIFLRDRKLGQI